jgi:hypothetical protein
MSRSAFSDSVGNQIFQAIYQGPSQTVAITNAHLESTPVTSDCDIIRIACDQDCFIEIGLDPEATTSSMFFPKGSVEYFGVDGNFKVSVLRKSVDGTLYITEGA